MLVNRHKTFGQRLDRFEEVVDNKTGRNTIPPFEPGYHADAIETSQRVIRHHDDARVIWQIVFATHLEAYPKTLHHVLAEVGSATRICSLQQVVKLILAHEAFKITHDKSWHQSRPPAKLFSQHTAYIYLYRTSFFQRHNNFKLQRYKKSPSLRLFN